MMGKHKNPLEEIQKARADSAANKGELLRKLREAHMKPTSPAATPSVPSDRADLNIGAVLNAANRLRLMPLGDTVGVAAPLNRPTLELLGHFLNVVSTRKSTVVLQWPFGDRHAIYLHPLAMLSLLCSPERQVTNNHHWCEAPAPLRTLVYPWLGGTSISNQNSHLVQRQPLLDWNKLHLTRGYVGISNSPALLGKMHETLGHLDRLKKRDQAKPHLAHPTLAEFYPIFCAEMVDGRQRLFPQVQYELFERVGFGAALEQLTDHRPALSQATSAPYALFAVSPQVDPKRALAAPALSEKRGLSPDICLLDLGPAAIRRLGPGWPDTVSTFVREARKCLPGIPFLAVTSDPFEHTRITTVLKGELRQKPESHILVRVTRDPITSDDMITAVSRLAPTFITMSGPTSDAITSMSEAARSSSNPSLAGQLRREMGYLRRAGSLPCGISNAYEILSEERDQATAEIYLGRLSGASILAPIEAALQAGAGGAERALLLKAKTAVQTATAALDQDTPVGSVLADYVPEIVGKSSPSIVAFGSETERLLAERRFADESETGQKLRRHLDRGFIIFTTQADLDACLRNIETTSAKNSWKRLLIVGPSIDWLSTLVVRPWLPEQLTVICERNICSRISETLNRLSKHPDIATIGELASRMQLLSEAATRELAARKVASVEFEVEPSSTVLENVIDLTDCDVDEGADTVVLSLASGRTLRARPRSAIIRYNPQAEVNSFERTTARDIRARQTLLVPDSAFVDEARDILPIRVLAQSWVELYHSTVAAQLTTVNGTTTRDKARTIHAAIQKRGARTQSLEAVQTWLRVEDYMKLPADQRQPHAPQARKEFDAFMDALGVPVQLADKMWLEGIQALRIDRRRAGQQLAQAFISVLVDPHGTASGFDASIREGIRLLREKALDHLDQVIATETIEGDHQ